MSFLRLDYIRRDADRVRCCLFFRRFIIPGLEFVMDIDDIFMHSAKKRGINVWKIYIALYFAAPNNAKLNIISE